MKELLEKITSYNIFNYLLPGVLFVTIAKPFTNCDFIQSNEILGLFLYYFIGMVISRFGSLIIEPVLKKISFLKFADYKDFITASKKDEKIDLLSEVNNTYRTVVSLLCLLLLLKPLRYFQIKWNISNEYNILVLLVLILAMFIFSYKKQTNYITKRIEIINKP